MLQPALGGRSLTDGVGLLSVLLGSWCCTSSPGARFAPCSQRGLSGGVCGRHVVGRGDAASPGLCGLAAREVLMPSVVDLAELLQGLNLGFYSPRVL